MADNKTKFIEKVAIEYLLDGASMDTALSAAAARWRAKSKSEDDFTYAEHKKLQAKLEALTLKHYKKIDKLNKKALKRQQIDDEKAHKQEVKRRLARFKNYLAQKKRLEQEQEAKANPKKGITSGFQNFGGRIGTIASYGAAIAVLNSLRQAITFVVTKTIEMESAFTDLAVKSGFTRREMANVSRSIFAVAESTQFSTLEIIGAATALGKLGFEGKEVSEILPNLGAVASATGESLQATAEILGKVIRAYEYTAEQSGVISDRMVDIFNNSALNLEKFNTAFSYVGSAASSTGTSFDELTAAMAILADRGITSSKIGTGLRNVFTKLGREGDSLRDIIVRVSEAHLSFYEVAELVGRRAANQLFIMADSLDEFDANVARSMDDYGTAMKAAAKQMDTFSNKWKIFINTITNNVAAPEFDPDSAFRDAVSESIDLMDAWNALWSRKAATQTIDRTIDQFPEFKDEFVKLRDELSTDIWGNVADDKTLTEMYKRLMDGAKKMKKGGQEWIRQTEYAFAIERMRAILFSSDNSESGISDKILDNEVEKAKNKVLKAVQTWKTTLEQTFKKAKSYGGSEVQTAFLKSFFQGDPKESLKVLQSVSEDIISEEDVKILLGGLRNRTDKMFGEFIQASDETLIKRLERQYLDAKAYVKTINKGDEEFTKKSIADDKKIIEDAIAERVKYRDEICKYFPKLATKLGIVCDEKKGIKPKGEIGVFAKNTQEEADYIRKKDRLDKEYDLEDDPEKKLAINNRLVNLEQDYRAQLLGEYVQYYADMADARDAFVKKYPDQAADYDAQVEKTKQSEIKDETKRVQNINTSDTRDLEAVAVAYKASVEHKQNYLLKMSDLSLQLRQLDRDDREGKERVINESNRISRQYYKDEESRLSLHYEQAILKLERIRQANILALGAPEGKRSQVDTAELEATIKKMAAEIIKLRTAANNAQKVGNKSIGDPLKDYDLFPDALKAYEDVYAVYSQIGDIKLELIKEQNERELALISERYDNEKAIVDASLNAGIVSQEQAQEANERLRRKKIDAENKANKTLFEAQKKRDKEDAIFTGISSTAQAIALAFTKGTPIEATIMAAISAAAISASTAMNIGAIGKRKFVPQKYADGGLIEGRSHSQGGVPFTVSGYGGFEAEGGEYIVNKEATRNNLAELERINGKTRTGKRKYATGGIVSADDVNSNGFNEALLEALNRPVRAYVTDQDLSKSESERNALSLKTSY